MVMKVHTYGLAEFLPSGRRRVLACLRNYGGSGDEPVRRPLALPRMQKVLTGAVGADRPRDIATLSRQ